MTYQGFKKLSVELPQEDFDQVADNLHYGMLTATIRQLFKSLGDKIEEEGINTDIESKKYKQEKTEEE